MITPLITRRNFIATGTALAGTSLLPIGTGVRAAFGAPVAVDDILVVVFLRFGACGLTMVPPADDAAKKPTAALN